MLALEGMESVGDVRRDIDVSDGEKDHVGKGVEVAESTGSVFDDSHDSVESFSDGIGEVCVDEGEDAVGMRAHGSDELFERLQTAPHGGGRPAVEEALGGPWRLVFPQLFELVLPVARRGRCAWGATSL